MHACACTYIYSWFPPILTREIPWLALVEVHLPDGVRREARVEELLQEVAGDDLLVGGMEPEARRQEQQVDSSSTML